MSLSMYHVYIDKCNMVTAVIELLYVLQTYIIMSPADTAVQSSSSILTNITKSGWGLGTLNITRYSTDF